MALSSVAKVTRGNRQPRARGWGARGVHHLSAWLFVGFLVAKNLLKGGLFKQQINWMRRSVAEGGWIMRIMITLMDKGLLKEAHAHAQPPRIEQHDGVCFPAPLRGP